MSDFITNILQLIKDNVGTFNYCYCKFRHSVYLSPDSAVSSYHILLRMPIMLTTNMSTPKTIITTDTNARSVQSARIAINAAAACIGRCLARRVIVAMAARMDMTFRIKALLACVRHGWGSKNWGALCHVFRVFCLRGHWTESKLQRYADGALLIELVELCRCR